MEDFLKRAESENSSLIQSFWYGKFLQCLPPGVLSTPPGDGSDSPDPPTPDRRSFISTHSVDGGVGDERGERNRSAEDGQELGTGGSQGGLTRSDDVRNVLSLTSFAFDGKPLSHHVSIAQRSLQHCQTSLSPNVFDLINTGSTHTASEGAASPVFLQQDYTLNWTLIEDYLGQDEILERKDYLRGARKCEAIARCAHEAATNVSPTVLQESLKQHFTWTNSPECFLECLHLVMTAGSLGAHTGLLIVSASLERSLGDVYLSVSKASQCPSLLKDLLSTEELEEVFGVTQMCLLRCLIGPPSGLNLRNVLWHGFSSPKELPREFSFFLLVVAASLGRILRDKGRIECVQHRPNVEFPQGEVMNGVFGGISGEDLLPVEQLFTQSFFILPTMLPTWIAALDCFRRKSYGHFLALMLPALEHGLRRVFACVNACPERVLTAESTVLYTTFDEILSPTLPAGEPNQLVEEIGDTKFEMLLDLLVHPEGPRLRDRVSHGEVDFHSVSEPIATYTLCVVVLFCAQYHVRQLEPVQSSLVTRCLMVEFNYLSLFHPTSILRRELLQLIHTLDQWRLIPKPTEWCETKTEREETTKDDSSPSTSTSSTFSSAVQAITDSVAHRANPTIVKTLDHVKVLLQAGHLPCNPVAVQPATAALKELVALVWAKPLSTVRAGRLDLELVGVLRRSVGNGILAVQQIRETALLRYAQHEQKQLRSRQRRNYYCLLTSLPTYQSAIILLVTMLVASAGLLPLSLGGSLQGADSRKQVAVIKFAKKILQFSENFYSQTSPVRNRWEETDKLCLSLATLSVHSLPVAFAVMDS